jgi:nicotinamide riboside kinase
MQNSNNTIVRSPKLICIIGAESTGKTTLAQQLAAQFRSPWVPEYLREFCDAQQRTPTRHEQTLILETQVIRERAALVTAADQRAPYVFCDTAPLLTAIYSEIVFADHSLYARALSLHARYALTLKTTTDVAWTPDWQRDGEAARQRVDASIDRALREANLCTVRVEGVGQARLSCALRALTAYTSRCLISF